MKNNNGAAVRRLSSRSLKNNKVRNLFAVCAIALTSMLFTAVFSFLGGMAQTTQESTMREVGTRAHAGLKSADMQQYEKAAADPAVKKCSYNILIGFAQNIEKRQAEIRYMPSAFHEALPDYFITLEEGKLPQAEDEIVVDTYVMDELKARHALGSKIPLTFSFMGKTIKKEFTVSGFYNGDAISHASELFISERLWLKLKGKYTEEDFRKWEKEHPQEEGVGLLSVNLIFDNASHLEEKVRTLIQNMGYEPETELDYGVNWAYMSNRLESLDPISFGIAAGALIIILLTGYLIIYNIFQISILNDIRFYGLLKTIGTTKKQLRRLIRRQIILLSVIGIPIGLLSGYIVGILGVPLLSRLMYPNEDLNVSLQFHPAILIFGAVFSMATVFLSCRKPGKIAGSVSPVEAVKYTEIKIRAGKEKKKRRHFTPVSMAWANLGRSRKKTGVVIAAISLSMILLTLVMTGVGSFRIEQFLEERVAGDAIIGTAGLFHPTASSRAGKLDENYIAFADAQPGIEQTDEMWLGNGKFLDVDEKAKAKLAKLDQEGKLDHSYGAEPLEQEQFPGYFFGYSDGLFKNIKVLEGSVDVAKFQSGNYILLTRFYGDDILELEDSPYHPGDKVSVSSITKDSKSKEITDEDGELIDVVYENLAQKEYEVMAVIDIPHSMDLSAYSPNGMDAVLPLKELKGQGGEGSFCFAKSYRLQDEYKEAFASALQDYTEHKDPLSGFTTKQSLEEEFSGMVSMISTIGISLSAVIVFIGILNFINAVFTSIISRKREFAMLQSIGMTTGQLRRVIICEGVIYVAAAGILSFVLGSIAAYLVINALNHVIMFFEYRFQIVSLVIMLPVLTVVAVATPVISFRQLRKESVVERLREAE